MFRAHMRGAGPEPIVQQAREAVGRLRDQRSGEYLKGMKSVKGDTTVLDFEPITDALDDIAGVGQFKGKNIKPGTEGIFKDLVRRRDGLAAVGPD